MPARKVHSLRAIRPPTLITAVEKNPCNFFFVQRTIASATCNFIIVFSQAFHEDLFDAKNQEREKQKSF